MGSPPRVRGRCGDLAGGLAAGGFTPACAGKVGTASRRRGMHRGFTPACAGKVPGDGRL